MDVHVLPGFLPDKKKKKRGSWGRVGVAHAAHLACLLNTNMPAEHDDDYQTVEPPNH